METLQVDADALLQEAAQLQADLTRRCLILAGQNSILIKQIRTLQEKVKSLENNEKVVPLKG